MKFGEATTWITWDIAQLVSLGGSRHKLMGLTSKHVEIVNHFNHLRYQNKWIMIKTKKIKKNKKGEKISWIPPFTTSLHKNVGFFAWHQSLSIDPRDHPCYGPSQQDRRQSPNRPPSASGFSSMTNQVFKGKKTWGKKEVVNSILKQRKDRSVLFIDWEESVMSNENWKWKASWYIWHKFLPNQLDVVIINYVWHGSVQSENVKHHNIVSCSWCSAPLILFSWRILNPAIQDWWDPSCKYNWMYLFS